MARKKVILGNLKEHDFLKLMEYCSDQLKRYGHGRVKENKEGHVYSGEVPEYREPI